MKYKKWFMLLTLISIFMLMSSSVEAQPTTKNKFVSEKHTPHEHSALLSTIKAEAPKRYIPPINARLDIVWHAIPGYNGLEVDIEKTYALAKKQKDWSNIQYVYREVPPKINLEDLEPAPIYRGNPEKQMVSIMINVAWGDEYISRILEILEKEQVHATFFFDGSWLSKHIDTAKEIAARGHELSNHAYSHKNMSRLSKQQAVQEISKTEALLSNQLGVKNMLFAPPSGDYSMETVKVAKALQLKTILWTVDTVDWKHPNPDSIIQKISIKIEPGAMVLLHPTNSSSRALEGMIKEIKRKGFVLDTVSELLSTKRIPAANTLILEEPIDKKST